MEDKIEDMKLLDMDVVVELEVGEDKRSLDVNEDK